MPKHVKTGSSKAMRTSTGEVRPHGNRESVRLPRNVPGQGRKPLGNPFSRKGK